MVSSCGALLIDAGFDIVRVITEDPHVETWASAHNISSQPYHKQLVEELSSLDFDYLFSVVNFHILPKALLGLAGKVNINYHDGPLPRYAGRYAPSWALSEGETDYSVCWHVIEPEIDVGDILESESITIDDNDTSFTLNAKCHYAGIDAFSRLIKALLVDQCTPTKQALDARSYYSLAKQPMAAGILDLTKPAADLERLCRAYDFGSVSCPWGHVKLLVKTQTGSIDTLVVNSVPCLALRQGKPGEILELSGNKLVVAVGEDNLIFEQILNWHGHTLSTEQIQSDYGLDAHDCLPILSEDEYHNIQSQQHSLRTHHSYWRKQLQYPAVVTSCAVLPANKLEYIDADVSAMSKGVSLNNWKMAVLTTFSLYIKQNFQGDAIGYVPSQPEQPDPSLPPLVSTTLPLVINKLPQNQVEAKNYLCSQLESIEQHIGFYRDLLLSDTADSKNISYAVGLSVNYTEMPDQNTLFHLAINTQQRSLKIWFHPSLSQHALNLDETLAKTQGQSNTSLSILHGPSRPCTDTTLWHLFRKQAEHCPDAIAIEYENTHITYGELDAQVKILASALWNRGVKPGQIVALHAERNSQMIISLLAILRLGASYLPLDPAYPSERLAFMLQDAKVSFLIGHGARPEWLDSKVEVFDLYEYGDEPSELPTACPASPDDLAYIIYTSGSTGKPKGVQIEHSSAVNFLHSMAEQPGLNRDDIVVAVTSISFDIAVLEIFLPLVKGARIVLADRQTASNGQALSDLLARHKATIMQATPTTWNLLLTAGWNHEKQSLKKLCGGEALSRELAAQLLKTKGELWNMYGPTEATVWCTAHKITQVDKAISIGRPIANTGVYILDNMQKPVDKGQIGELFISGEGLSRGYLNRPELTAQRFIDIELSEEGKTRLYRTGDLASVDNADDIAYHGRIDNQVKVRGYRIELEEIEAALEKLDFVTQAVVGLNERVGVDANQTTSLIGYLTLSNATSNVSRDSIREQLSATLPDYMIPDRFAALDTFPLTPNGKVDRSALAQSDAKPILAGVPQRLPQSFAEQQLAQRWSKLLGQASIGMNESFFNVGGNSLLAGHLVQDLSELVGEKINPVMVFSHPTIQRMASALSKQFGDKWLIQDKAKSPQIETSQIHTKRAEESNNTPLKATPTPALPAQEQGLASSDDAVAIVGMACRFPGADNLDTFFQNLCKGEDAISDLPPSRYQWMYQRQQDYPVSQQGSLNDISCFDYGFFGISAREARRMDPMHRIAIEIAHEAVECAGYSTSDFSVGQTAVYMGSIASEYSRLLADSELYLDAQTGTGNAMSLLANRISYLFDWKGPSLVVDTACSSSLVCVDLAMKAIRAGQIDAALVGGVNLVLVSDNTVRFAAAGMLSDEGRCHTFDQGANGYVRGEGCGAVLLKPLAQAIADGDHIWSVIRGSAVNHDGRNKVGLTAPNPEAQQNVLKQAYQDASCAPDTIAYLEAHGTGTSLGDPIEVHALTEFFKEQNQQSAYCAIGSVKSNIGHLEPAAGIAGLIKASLGLKSGVLLPTLHVSQPNQHIQFENSPFYINDRCRSWHRGPHPRRAGISSFGFGGANAHVVVEEAPALVEHPTSLERPWHLFTLSAKSNSALERMVNLYIESAKTVSDDDFEAFCANVNQRRQTFDERLAVIAGNREQLLDKLSLWKTQQHGARKALSLVYSGKNINASSKSKNAENYLSTLNRRTGLILLNCFQDRTLEQYRHVFSESSGQDIEKDTDVLALYKGVAQLYVMGFRPNWQTLYEGKEYPNKPLPTYPFEKTPCWIDSLEKRRFQHGHPLVKREKAHLYGACYQLDLAPSLWVLNQHHVGNKAVLPGAALIDLAHFISRQQFGSLHFRLHQIHFYRPLGFATDGQDWRLLLRTDEEPEVLVYNHNENDEPWLSPYFRARITFTEMPNQNLDLLALQNSCIDQVPVSNIYRDFERAGLYYGKEFRCLKDVRTGEGNVLGILETPSQTESDYLMHPALLDAAFQTALGPLLAQSSGALYLPFIVAGVDYIKPLSKHVVVVVKQKGTSNNSASVEADISLLDKDGEVCVFMEGVTWRRIEQELANKQQRKDLLERLRLPQWVEAENRNSAPASGLWIVFGDKSELSQYLIQHLRDADCRPVLVEKGQDYELLKNDNIKLSAHQATHYTRLLTWLNENEDKVSGVLYLWDLHSNNPETDAYPLLNHLYFVQGLSATYRSKPLTLRIATKGAATIGSEQTNLNPWAGATSAFWKVASMEFPNWDCAVLDLSAQDSSADKAQVPVLGQALLAELGSDKNQPVEIALRPNSPIKRLKLTLQPAKSENLFAPSRLRDGGIYMITGGLGSIGIKLTSWLVSQYRATVVLLARRIPQQLPQPLASLVNVGHSIVVIQANVVDNSAVCRAVEQVQAEIGTINGIFHAAGVLEDGMLTTHTKDKMTKVLQPKVEALKALEEAVDFDQLDFLLLFSSVSGLEGNIGQASYAAANRFLDIYAHQQHAKGRPILSVDWGLWSDTRMGQGFVETAKSRGLPILSSVQGIAVVEEVLRRFHPQTAMVASAEYAVSDCISDTVTDNVQSLAQSHDRRPAQNEASPEVLVASTKADKDQTIELVTEVIANLLERSPADIDIDTPFLDIGLDSVLAVTGVNKLESKTGLKLPPTLLFDSPTVRQLAEALIDRYGFATPESSPQSKRTSKPKEQPKPYQPTQPVTSLGNGSKSKSAPSPDNDHDIAIIGMSGRFPGASNTDELWELLAKGENAITEVPNDRWDASRYFEPESDAIGKIYAKWGGFIDKPYDFDSLFFRLSPRDAEWVDPQQRLLLETTWEALESAGYAGALQESKTGVFVAASYSHYRDQNVDDDIQTPAGLGNLNAILANRISYFFNFKGPSLTVDTLCSSSLVALNIAVQNLRAGICQQAVVSGVHVDMSPRYYQMACRLRAFSPSGRCHSFGRQADGFVPGEGCASILLKPLKNAVEDGDNILGVIKGTAVNHGGQGSGLTVPRASEQANLIRSALEDASLNARSISYIEAHGTGTALGDPIEVAALNEVFTQAATPLQQCAIGTIKTNIGHLEPAAGMAGLIKVLLSLKHKQLPPSLVNSEVNPAIQFEDTPFYLNDRLNKWESSDGIMRAGISSFGMGGVNAHVIVEQPPHINPVENNESRSEQLLILSARSQTALEQLAYRFANRYETFSQDDAVGDICRTLAMGRAHFKYRLAMVVNQPEQIHKQLQNISLTSVQSQQASLDAVFITKKVRNTKPKIAFLFSGQGSQLPAMAQELYQSAPVFRDCLNHCAKRLDPLLPRPLLDVLYGEHEESELINETGYAQPLLFAIEYSLAQLLISWNIQPSVVLGHSLGEFVAACVADVITLDDALQLIAERAKLMQSLPKDKGGMVALLCSRQQAETFLERYPELSLAADNGPASQTLSGDKATLQKLVDEIGDSIRTIPLSVSHAFHSPMLKPAAEQLSTFANQFEYKQPNIPLISNLTGKVYDDTPNGQYWADHMLSTVQFADGLSTLYQLGVDMVVEIGPQDTLLKLLRQLPDGQKNVEMLPALQRNKSDWESILSVAGRAYVEGSDIAWDEIYQGKWQRKPLPTYPFERSTHRVKRDEKKPSSTPSYLHVVPTDVEHPLLGRRLK